MYLFGVKVRFFYVGIVFEFVRIFNMFSLRIFINLFYKKKILKLDIWNVMIVEIYNLYEIFVNEGFLIIF